MTLLCLPSVKLCADCATPVTNEVGGDLQLQLPFIGGPFVVTQGYCNGDHSGYQVDYSMSNGTPVVAAASGLVVEVNDYAGNCTNLTTVCNLSTNDQGGIWVKIKHQSTVTNYYSSYLQLSKRLVETNDWMQAGQIIGLSGNTGLSTGPHLHFHIRTGPNNTYQGVRPTPMQGLDTNSGQNPILDFAKDHLYLATALTGSNLVATAEPAIQLNFPTHESYQYQIYFTTNFMDWFPASELSSASSNSDTLSFNLRRGDKVFYRIQ